MVGPPPRRRYPPPRAGYIYVVQQGQGGAAAAAPRAVRAEDAPFIIRRVTVASYRTAEGGTVLFEVQVNGDEMEWKGPRRVADRAGDGS